MRFYPLIIAIFLLVACTNTKDNQNDVSLNEEDWLFNFQYIKAINESSWEKFSIVTLNNYADFKIEFSYISTGKPQTCGLYAKGVVVNKAEMQNSTTQTKILMRPNLIPNSPIWITKHTGQKGNSIQIEIGDISGFIQACGDAHQYATGIYDSVQ